MGFESRYRGSGESLADMLAHLYGFGRERARELLLRAEQLASEDQQARTVQQWFALLVEDDRRGARGRGTAEPQSPGRETLVMRAGQSKAAGPLAPGRETLVMRAGQSKVAGPLAPGRETLVMRAAQSEVAVPSVAPAKPEPGRLEVAVQSRMSQAFGFDFSGVSIKPDSPIATGSTRAVVKDGEVHFRQGAYRPGTREGDWLIGHELAHIVQQQGGRGDRAGSHKELEREADRAATLISRGQMAPIALRAAPAVAYAFNEGDEHEAEEAPAAAGGEAIERSEEVVEGDAEANVAAAEKTTALEPASEASAKSESEAQAEAEAASDHDEAAPSPEDVAPEPEDVAQAQPSETTEAAAESAPEPETAAEAEVAAAEPDAETEADAESAPAADGGTGSRERATLDPEPGGAADEFTGEPAGDPVDPKAELAAATAPVPSEGEGGGAPGGGGGAPARPVKPVPKVAGTPPETGLIQLRGVRPDHVAPALGQVNTAAGADVAKTRAKQAAAPPKQMSTGDAAARRGKGSEGGKDGKDGKDGPGDGRAPKGAKPDVAAHAAKPVKGEVPGGKERKQAEQGEAAQQQKDAGAITTNVGQAITSWLRSWTGGSAEGADKLSDAEQQRMAGSLDHLSADASGISTATGPAPSIAMKGEAKTSTDRDRADLDRKTAGGERQGHADAAVRMGEDHIETTVPTEELSAKLPPTASAPGAALPTVAGAAPSEEIGIIAQETHGAEIDAALSKASAEVATERAKHEQKDARARADADTQIRDLKTKADTDQTAARTAAKAEATKARGEWKAEVDKKGSAARKQADAKVAEGMTEVEAEETKANEEAKAHIEDGKQKADAEKQKGEREAKEAKDKGKAKSSGFLGWLSSKAKTFFDGIKQAVSKAIDAARKAVKAVIDAAKKLAMAAIELARKAIVAAIKAIGKALIAISDILLAAFPELKAKFQGLIKKAVDKAVETVNKLAAGLKKTVQKALDLLGAALDKALQLLEKGLHFIVDAANAVVQGAIKAAEAIASALGEWLKLLKDVASAPGAWIGKLGSAIVDGIKHHLWSAFKAAVVGWFKSKVFELLGVGGIILQILLDGGISKDDIIQMALDALIVAIPAALIAILIEKLVSMIVPAAGAVLAIIQSLQAAWGTISRIIAAFGAFMAFLMAVKSGGAGPLFATALAAAAIVLLDFVANWLLRKLAGAARKVGARLKGMADKFKARGSKGKGKPGAKAKDGPDVARGKPSKHDDGPDGSPTRPKRKDHDHDGSSAKGKPGSPRPKQPGSKPKDPKHKSKDPKHKKDGKDKQQQQHDKDRAAVQRAAREAARRAWGTAGSAASRQVVSKARLESSIGKTSRAAKGISVHTELVQMGSRWRIRATARKAAIQATHSDGNGSALRSKAGGGVYFVARDIAALERRVAEHIRAKLQRPDGDGQTTDAELRSRIAAARRDGQQQLDGSVRGLRLSLRPEAARGDGAFEVKGLIDPNYWEWEMKIDGADGIGMIRDAIQSHAPTGRMNQVLTFLKQLAREHHVKIDMRKVQTGGYDRTTNTRWKKVEYKVKYTNKGKSLDVTVGQVPGSEVNLCALSDRPLGADTSYPHDAIAEATWKAAFATVAATMGITQTDFAYVEMLGRCSDQKGASPAVADGKSTQPFDGAVHGKRSAIQRHDDGDPTSLPNYTTWLGNPAIGPVTKDEYQGKDWAPMDRKQKLAGVAARAQIMINDIKEFSAKSNMQGKITSPTGTFGTMQRANAFLDAVYVVVLRLARKR